MGSKKLLKKLAKYFDMDARARIQKKKEMNELLSRLKQKEASLKDDLEKETNEDLRSKLAQKIDVVHTQRKKGVQMLKDLRDEGDKKDA